MKGKILITGAGGQVGTELAENLRDEYGSEAVVATDIQNRPHLAEKGPFDLLNVLDPEAISEIIRKNEIGYIYHLAALLSAKGEQNPQMAWKVNMDGLLNILEAARHEKISQVFWPSSIAVFGPGSPKDRTPQNAYADPNTVYGISKLAGERWCEYYHFHFGLDVRSIRYPGLIGYKSDPGGGTTDYAVEIFHKAIEKGKYTCFLSENTHLPMLYMPDAIRATLELMKAPADRINVRSSYNLSGLSFSPEEISEEIKKYFPHFECAYNPDFRQQIADSWPNSIDDSPAREDWGWKQEFGLEEMTRDMLIHLGKNHPQVHIK